MTATINASTSSGVIVTSDTSGALALQTANTTAMTIDTSQNVGIGVTPSAWSQGKAFEMYAAGYGLWNGTGVPSSMYMLANAYFNSGFKYGGTGQASHYYQYQGAHVWSTAASGTAGNAITFTQAMTLDASGRLNIGATSNSYGAVLELTTSNGLISWQNSTAANGAYSAWFNNGTGNGYIGAAAQIASGSASDFAIHANNALVFASGGSSERARITSGGFFKASNSGTYVGSTGSYHELYNNGAGGDWTARITNSTTTAANAYGITINYTGSTPNGTDNYFINANDSSANRFQLRSNGGIANYSANNVNLSDRREKTNFAPAGSYLDKICAIHVQTFNYIDQNLEQDGGLTLGVVAQDVQAVAPELVMESNWADKDEPEKMRLSIYQTDLQYALMKCIQEQQTIIESLTARLTALENK